MLKTTNRIFDNIKIILSQYRGNNNLKVIVTGPPRSGTSFLTGLISRMGFSPGPEDWLKKGDEHNKYGYFECMPLWKISFVMLKNLGGSFHKLPACNPGWTAYFNAEKKKITRLVKSGGIELYKDNQLLILSELYHELFPDAKWVFINRDIKETYKSRFGEAISFDQWELITKERLNRWHSSPPSEKALYLNYQDFKDDKFNTINDLQSFLGIELNQYQLKSCLNFFKPRH